jgi:hypothetical protein
MTPLNVASVDVPGLGAWLASAIAAPLAIALCTQILTRHARREHLRLARDQLELAALLDQHIAGSEANELRRRARSETARYLRPRRRPKYVLIILGWIYVGVATSLLALAEMQTAAEAGPGPVVNWILFGIFGLAMGTIVACAHIALKDQVLNAANWLLARLTRNRLSIPRPPAW